MVSRLKTICNLLGIKGYKIRQIYKILGIAKTCDAFYSLLRKKGKYKSGFWFKQH